MVENRINIGINGYGRIGRAFHRHSIQDPSVHIAAINSRTDAETMAHLLKYDSVYGRLDAEVEVADSGFSVNGEEIQVYQEPSPESIPWVVHDIDIIVESTGKFKDLRSTAAHLARGGQHVIVCCPPISDAIPAIVMGVNEQTVNLKQTPIISNASCTTNALAPMLRVLDEAFGIEFCSFRTIHAITDSQHLLDNADANPRYARGAFESIIPSATGASDMIKSVFPHLQGKVNGLAYRVPTRTVSNIDLCVKLIKQVTADQVNLCFIEAANGVMHGIVGVTDEPLVSIDFSGDASSVTVDLGLTTDCGNSLFNLAGWYDNEWGYSARVLDLVHHVADHTLTYDENEKSSALSLTA